MRLLNKIARQVSESELKDAFTRVSSHAAKVGLTTIHCIEGGGYWETSILTYFTYKASDFYPCTLFQHQGY